LINWVSGVAHKEIEFAEDGSWSGVRFFKHAGFGVGMYFSRAQMTNMWIENEPQGPTGVMVVHKQHDAPEAIKPIPADVTAARGR